MSGQTAGDIRRPLYRKLSVRRNFLWVLAGDFIYSLSGWLILILLVKLGSTELVGVYALGVAVCMPVSMLVNLGLTGGLVTDVSSPCRYGRYLALRLLSAAISILVVAVIVFMVDYTPRDRLVVLLVGVSTAIAAVREILLAVMKRNECMSLVGRSQIAAGCSMLAAFAATFWLTRSLPWSVVAICLTRAVVALFHDLPHVRGLARTFDKTDLKLDWSARPLFALGATTAPLALALALGSLIQNIPRYLLEGYHGADILGYFAAMAAVVAASTRLMGALGTAVTPRLARHFLQNRRAYVRLTLQVGLIALSVGGVAILTAHLFGRSILTFLFTGDFANFDREFVLLMVNLTIMLLVSCTNQALVASRAFKHVSLLNAGVCLTSLFFAWLWIGSWGLRGACWAMIATSTCWLAVLATFFVVRVRKGNALESRAEEPESTTMV